MQGNFSQSFNFYLFSLTRGVIFSSCVSSSVPKCVENEIVTALSSRRNRKRGGGIAESANGFTSCVYMRRAGLYQDICRQSTSAYVGITWKYISLSLFLLYKISLARVVNLS